MGVLRLIEDRGFCFSGTVSSAHHGKSVNSHSLASTRSPRRRSAAFDSSSAACSTALAARLCSSAARLVAKSRSRPARAACSRSSCARSVAARRLPRRAPPRRLPQRGEEERLVSGGGRLGGGGRLAAAGAGRAGAAAGAGAKRGCTIGDGGSGAYAAAASNCSCLAASSRLIAPGDGMSLGGFFGWLSISERNCRASRLTSTRALASRCSSARRAAAASVMKPALSPSPQFVLLRRVAAPAASASLHRSAAPAVFESLLRSRVRGASAPPWCQRGHNSAAERRRGCRRRADNSGRRRHRGREVAQLVQRGATLRRLARGRGVVMEDRKLKKRKFKMVENQNHSDAKLARMKEIVRQRLAAEAGGGGEAWAARAEAVARGEAPPESPNPSRSPSRRSRRSPTCPTRRRSRRCRRSSR